MLTTFALFLAVLCTVSAFSLDSQLKDAKEKRGGEGEGHEHLSHEHVKAGADAAKQFIYPYKDHIDGLVGELLTPRQRSEDDWKTLAQSVATLMKHGRGIYEATLDSLERSLFTMFHETNDFKKEAQCHQLWVTVEQEGFGDGESHVQELLLALAKDLICIDNLLSDVYNLESEVNAGGLTEMDVLKGILEAMKNLFKLKNSGGAMYIALAKATEIYEKDVDELHKTFMDSFHEPEKKSLGDNALLERILAALQKKRD